MDAIAKKLADQINAEMFRTICGPIRKRPQTALLARGNWFETVELDDAGNIIEPVRCICGSSAIIHSPRCPFYCMAT